jgi:hypothetical protein
LYELKAFTFYLDLRHDQLQRAGGVPLTDVVLGRSHAMNFRGEPYYFFVFKPEVDIHVSASMLRAGGNFLCLDQLLSTYYQ